MNEHDRANKLMILTMTVVCLLVAGSVGLVWSSGNALPSKPIAEAPKAKAQVASPQVDAVAMLDERLVEVESKMKVPPAFDTSQLKAQLKGLGSQLAAIQTQLGTFKGADFDAFKTKIDSVVTANSESVKTTIDALQTDVGNLNKRFDQLSQQAPSVTAPDDVKHRSQKPQHSKSK
ncbi:hypothetical protein [Nitrobacter sp. TKz-YC02]|uniref:hypothetical protein n=1 Tax=Nitrobacter sp. TKz-YC02 TaxID=3398704 RepID=UPI003CF1B90A